MRTISTDDFHLFESAFLRRTVHSLNEFASLGDDEKAHALITAKILAAYPIKECGEPLMPLADWLANRNSRIQLTAGEAEYGVQSLETHMLRKSVAERLTDAESFLRELNPEYTFKITDTFRPLSLQKQYFEKIKQSFSGQGLAGDALYEKTTEVIADPDLCPPHSTGGAIDLTITNLATGKEIDMGSKLDEVSDPLAYTFHPTLNSTSQANRLALLSVMTRAGFAHTASEWWHYSYGDQEWAIRTGSQSALYGSVISQQ